MREHREIHWGNIATTSLLYSDAKSILLGKTGANMSGSSLMIKLKRSKKINRLLGEPELPAEPSSLALMFLLWRAKPSELQSPKAVTVGNVNKTDNRKDYVDNSQKKTEKHFKNVRELKDISNTDKEKKQTNVLGKKEPLKTDKTENVGDNTK